MSEKQYELFLVEKLKSWFSHKHQPTAGSRYQFKSPDPENTRKLVSALHKISDGELVYADQKHPYILVGSIKLLFAGHMEKHDVEHGCYTENYISMLRDAVSGQDGSLVGTALLIIHNSLLDTLINSAFDLSSIDAVWSPSAIQGHLEALIKKSGRYTVQSECLLEHHARFVELDGASMFGFRELYEAMADDGDLRFDELGLFPDEAILRSDDRRHVEDRLDKNRKLMEQINWEIEHYPNELEERLSDFGSKFIKEHFLDKPGEEWRKLDFSELNGEIKKQREQELEFSGIEETFFGNIACRNKSNTTAGKRKKHLLISAPDDQNTFEFKIRFEGKKLEPKDLSVVPQRLEQQISISQRALREKSTFTISCQVSDTPMFFTLRLNRERANEKYNFYCVVMKEGRFDLTDIENCFLVDCSKEAIILEANEHILRLSERPGGTIVLKDSGETIDLTTHSVIDFTQIYEDSDDVRFTVVQDDSSLKIRVEGEPRTASLVLPQLLDKDRFSQLFSSDASDGVYKATKGTVVVDNQESEPIIVRKKLLKAEQAFLDDELICWNADTGEGNSLSDLNNLGLVEIADTLSALFDYLRDKRTLPSLCSWGETFTSLAKNFQDAILAFLSSIPDGHTLSDAHRLAMKIGFVTIDGRKYFSPYHPLVLSYYLNLVMQIRDDGDNKSFRDLPQVTTNRLNPRGLLPYVHDPLKGYGYTHAVEENPMWLEIVPREESSFDFVQNLVRDKVEEFIRTFGDLFAQVNDAPLIVNSVNNGKNGELFLGLISYFKKSLESSRRIHVNLYDLEFTESEFDEFAELGSYENIKTRYGLDKGKIRENADTVIDLLRTKLTFSKFEHNTVGEQKYAHLTFFKNNQKIDCVGNDIDIHLSGVACDGLLNGETSVCENDQYFTAYGMSNVDTTDFPHLKVAKLVGSLLKPALSPQESFHQQSAIRLAVSGEFKNLLEKSYDSSLWTTIIEPKVTLSFFGNSKGILLIHYSDQYTSSSGYDAITVTKRAELYRSVLQDDGSNLINEFNAFNGEWLLKLVTDPETEKKGKRGIIGAYKVVSCLLSKSDITWVPLSVAEMIRVAGNIGLAMADSDFSRHNLKIRKGAISDDILFAGFKDGQLYLLPVEVKTGSRPDFKKARIQVLELKEFMENALLKGGSLKNKIFRALFVRQVLLQVEKYKLYEVFDETYFDSFLEEREQWLSGNYKISQLPNYPVGMVIAHIQGAYTEKYDVHDGVLQAELPMGFLDEFVKTPHRDLKGLLVDNNRLNIGEEYFLKPLTEVPIKRGVHESHEGVEVDTTQPIDVTEPIEIRAVQQVDSTEPIKVQFGQDVLDQQPVFWEPTNTEKLFNTNTGIIGTMGTGKTQFTKSVITQLYREQHNNVDGKPIGILIFDYKADYVKDDFVKATNAKVFDLYHLPFNPFALFGNRPMQPVHTANLFRATLTKAFGLGAKQQNRIRTLVMDAYESAGINPQNSATWSSPVPTLQDVWALFQDQEKIEQDSLYAALDDLISFEIFEPDTSKTQSLYDLIDGVTVINLSGYDSQIQNLVVALTLDLFYIQMQQQGSSKLTGPFRQISKVVLVDEADNFMSQDFESLKKILKEGREFGVGTILSTQELTHFKTGENDYSSLILTWVIHQVANIRNQEIKTIFNSQSRQDEEAHMSNIRMLEKHHSLYVDGKKKIRKIKDLAFWELT